MNKLEYKYGKKVLQIFDKGNRFKFFGSLDDWNQLCSKYDSMCRSLAIAYEVSKLKHSLKYSLKLTKLKAKNFSNPKKIPKLYDLFFKSKTDGNIIPYANIQTFMFNVYNTESF